METYLPDAATRAEWRRMAVNERYGARVDFWTDAPALPERPADAHKGTFGVALATGGSRGMAGAIALAGSAALVTGAGLVRLAVPDAILETVAQFQREYTTLARPCDAAGRFSYAALDALLEDAKRATAVAVGPGMGRSPALDRLVAELFFELEVPAVFDADALNALASAGVFSPERRATFAGRFPKGERVLTPHPGEFARLSGVKPTGETANRMELSARWLKGCVALFHGADSTAKRDDRRALTLLLKGPGTVVTELAFMNVGGHKLSQTINTTGNVGLATGGSGDVLTGVILGLLARGASGGDAARAGAALHGLAAELRSSILSVGAIAGDVVRFLPAAIEYYELARRECR